LKIVSAYFDIIKFHVLHCEPRFSSCLPSETFLHQNRDRERERERERNREREREREGERERERQTERERESIFLHPR
jgi:hypothetical protein